MDFKDIIKRNYESLSGKAKQWCRYAFHYTDISNAVEILSSGMLYSRNLALKAELMHNDNASRQVIDCTKSDVTDCVRFYFRPLTPTQYYNEGFKHKDIRYENDVNANVLVPIFFVFNLDKLLHGYGIGFSEQSLAGNGCECLSTVGELAALDFDKIYSYGFTEDRTITKYRHAEITTAEKYNIDESLSYIICRNTLERKYLLQALQRKNKEAYEKYIGKIFVSKKENMFYCNGLHIDDCICINNHLYINFSNVYKRKRYALKIMKKTRREKLDAVREKLCFEWFDKSTSLKKAYLQRSIDYLNVNYQNIKLPVVEGAESLRVKIYIEEALMCDVELDIGKGEVY